MQYVGVRDLANRASALLDKMCSAPSGGESVVVTKHGRPVALLSPIDQDALYDFLIENAPEYVASRKAADERIAAGDYGTPADEFFDELEAEERSA